MQFLQLCYINHIEAFFNGTDKARMTRLPPGPL